MPPPTLVISSLLFWVFLVPSESVCFLFKTLKWPWLLTIYINEVWQLSSGHLRIESRISFRIILTPKGAGEKFDRIHKRKFHFKIKLKFFKTLKDANFISEFLEIEEVSNYVIFIAYKTIIKFAMTRLLFIWKCMLSISDIFQNSNGWLHLKLFMLLLTVNAKKILSLRPHVVFRRKTQHVVPTVALTPAEFSPYFFYHSTEHSETSWLL